VPARRTGERRDAQARGRAHVRAQAGAQTRGAAGVKPFRKSPPSRLPPVTS
jgi:hypothetical protein